MKQKTIATRHLRTKIAAGYVLILFVIFGIVYIWLNEQNRQQELEATTYKIRSLRKDVHEVYMKVVDLSMIGETVLDWNEEDMTAYHEKRLEVDSLLSRFKSRTCRSERIDSICQLLAEKEKLLNRIMLVLYEQEEIKEKIARQVPAIALKSSQEEPKKRKRTGFLGLFGKKEEAKPTATTTMLNTLNSGMIARQKEQSERLSQYTDSLSVLFNRSQDRIRVKTHIPDISTYKVIMASCIRSIYSTGSIKTYRFMMGNTVPKFTYGCQFSVNI